MKFSILFSSAVLAITLAACQQPKVYTFVQYNVGAFSKYDASGVEAIADAIREINADAVTLNELDSCTTRTGRVDQLAAFAREMEGWNQHFAAAMPYKGGAYGVGVASAPGLKVISTGKIALPKMNGHEPRAVAIVEYEDFVLCSTHLDLTLEAQLEQVNVINHYIDSLYAGGGKPIFIGGDFNCFPDSEPIAHLKESWTLLTPVSDTFPSHEPDRCIDYIFVRPNGHKVTVRKTAIPRHLETSDLATASDHLPVVLTVSIE